MKSEQKYVNASELNTVSMVARNEKRYPTVIDEGVVKNWVGFGWVSIGKATKADYRKYPVVKYRK